MKLSEAAKEVEEWLEYFTYNYEITNVLEWEETGGYEFLIYEYGPSGECNFDLFSINVRPDMRLTNEDKSDLIEIVQEAYDNDERILSWVRDFKKKWYKTERGEI